MLSVNDPNVFDIWRNNYEKMTDQEHFDFYDQLEAKYPDQAHYNLEALEYVIDFLKPVDVTEAGGWKGNAAAYFLKKGIINHWLNFELCNAAIENTVQEMPAERYDVVKIQKLDWFEVLKEDRGDLFLATHFIEHLSDAHFESLISNLSHYPAVYFEAPIVATGSNNWQGYFGTHILSYSWQKVIDAMKWHGFEAQMIAKDCYLFMRDV